MPPELELYAYLLGLVCLLWGAVSYVVSRR